MAFASALGNFTFQTIGEQTEDEKMISKFWFMYVCSEELAISKVFQIRLKSSFPVQAVMNYYLYFHSKFPSDFFTPSLWH